MARPVHGRTDLPDVKAWPMPILRGRLRVWNGPDFTAVSDATTPTVEFGGGRYVIPERFDVLFRLSAATTCQLRVELRDRKPVCVAVAVAGDDEVSTAQLRVPLTKLVRTATSFIGGLVINPDEGIEVKGTFFLVARDERAEFDAALDAEAVGPQRGRKLPDAQLVQVAEVYRAALAQGLPPTNAVFGAFPISRSTAGRWVEEARRRGFLGAADPGRAGEAKQSRRGSHGKRH